MKKSVLTLAMLAMNVVAEPVEVAPVAPVVEQVDKVVEKEFTIQETSAKITSVLEAAFSAAASVKDEATLAAAGVKLDELSIELLALEPQLDATAKPDDKQMKEAAVNFVRMTEKVSKQMQAMMANKLAGELEKGREAQFMNFLKASAPVKLKMDALMPPAKLNQFVKEIKAEQAAAAGAEKAAGASE